MVKRVTVRELTEGNVISENVYSADGKVLLVKDNAITSRHIRLLQTWDVCSVVIYVGEDDGDEDTQEAQLPAGYGQFIEDYDVHVNTTIQSFELIRKHRMIPVTCLKETAGNISTTISRSSFSVMNHLLLLESKIPDFIPQHSVMVAYLAGVIAHQLRWPAKDVAGVVFAGLLHDIGSLGKEASGDKCTQINLKETCQLLRITKGLSKEVIMGVMQHRERDDGSGFPNRTCGESIHHYAKIIAIADYFHNLVYSAEAINPLPVLDTLSRDMYGKFDPQICRNFIDKVRESLLFNKIVLSSGQEGEIIFFNRDSYSLPIVKTVDNQILDLAKCGDVTIQRLLTIPA